MVSYSTSNDLKELYKLSNDNHHPLSHLHRGEDHDTKTIQAIFKLYVKEHLLSDDIMTAQCQRLVISLNKHHRSKDIHLIKALTFSPFRIEGVLNYNVDISVPWAFTRYIILAKLPLYHQNLLENIIARKLSNVLPKPIDLLMQDMTYKLSLYIESSCDSKTHKKIYSENFANDIYNYLHILPYMVKLKSLIEGEFWWGVGSQDRIFNIALHPFEYLKWKTLCTSTIEEFK